MPLDSSALVSGGTDGVPVTPAPGGAGGVPDVVLQPYDNVLIMRQAGWDGQRLVYLTGQVKHPGRYALRNKTERLRDLIERAGGLTGQAYAGGIQFYRAYYGGESPTDRTGWGSEIGRSSAIPRGYDERVGLDLPRVLKDRKFRDNIILAGGDSIHLPEYNPIVMVQDYHFALLPRLIRERLPRATVIM